MSHSYTLTLTDKQARWLQKALDFYTRIGIGQWQEFTNVIYEMMSNGLLPTSSGRSGERADELVLLAIEHAKQVHLDMAPNASFGIVSPDVADPVKVLYDLGAVLRKAIAKADRHSPMSVWHDSPMHLGSEPLASIELKRDGEEG